MRVYDVGTICAVSVVSHLAVSPAQYDARIRSLIPLYDELIAEVARALGHAARPLRIVVDLGIGTGALARACLESASGARVWGIDADPDMMAIARTRLGRLSRRVTMTTGSFLNEALPSCDAIVASYSLHHIPTRRAKLAFYRRCYRALRSGGILINGDVHRPRPRADSHAISTSGSRISERRSAAARVEDTSTSRGPTRTSTCRSPKRSACWSALASPWTCRGDAHRCGHCRLSAYCGQVAAPSKLMIVCDGSVGTSGRRKTKPDAL
jgi:SAM-dependent methyltransferase